MTEKLSAQALGLKTAEVARVSVDEDRSMATVRSSAGESEHKIEALPDRFWGWLMEGRRNMYESLGSDPQPAHFAQHLPMVVTQNEEGPFSANCCNKGVGHLPLADHLEAWNEKLKQVHLDAQGKLWKESFALRLDAVKSFYAEETAISALDRRCMVGLEIFEGRSRRNLIRNPYLSLLFTGSSPEYISFQVDCLVQAVDPTDPRFQFAQRMRTLFEYDSFHITQPQFSVAYLFWVIKVIDKTPYRVHDQNLDLQESPRSLDWKPEALERIGRAPSMIRLQIIRDVERYAKRRGFDTIDAALLAEARENLMGAESHASEVELLGQPDRFSRFLVAADNSPLSIAGGRLAVRLADRFGSEIVGCHVYAARLHEVRFKQMEPGLPEAFQEEEELQRQRDIHGSLIEKGLGLISDSYLSVLDQIAGEKNIVPTRANREGPNYRELIAQMEESDCDIAFLGVRGLGEVQQGFPGSVCRRVARGAQRDLWIVKREMGGEGPIVACVDGSDSSFAAVKRAIRLATALERSLHLVSAYDPHFHDVAFRSIAGVLSDEAAQVFRFEEQEKLHEEIINDGLAKIYQDHLDTAIRMVRKAGLALSAKLLAGKPYVAILEYAQERDASLICVGKTGFHHDPSASIGSNVEALLHLSECDLLIVRSQHHPQDLMRRESGIHWTKEAEARLAKIPERVRPMARMAIGKEAEASGEKEITAETVQRLMDKLHPGSKG